MDIPWRIAAQAVTILNEEKEPALSLVFETDLANAAVSRLTLRTFEEGAAAIEVVFNAGGYLLSQRRIEPKKVEKADGEEAPEEKKAKTLEELNGDSVATNPVEPPAPRKNRIVDSASMKAQPADAG